jgi:hypothetical protein
MLKRRKKPLIERIISLIFGIENEWHLTIQQLVEIPEINNYSYSLHFRFLGIANVGK